MVIIAATPEGLQQALALPTDSGISIWCGSEAISHDDFKALKAPNLTRFSRPISEHVESDLSAELDVIRMHHPNEIVFVENITPPE